MLFFWLISISDGNSISSKLLREFGSGDTSAAGAPVDVLEEQEFSKVRQLMEKIQIKTILKIPVTMVILRF
jgi:hypothetical protein